MKRQSGGRLPGGNQGGGSPRQEEPQQGHLDPDVLAEFRAGLIADRGLIAGRRGRAVAAHLAGCAECAALDERLAQVSALLAAAPVPTVPDALARRLDSALAALAAEAESPDLAERTSLQPPSPRHVPSWVGVLGGSASRGDEMPRGDGVPRGRWVFRVRVLAPAAAALAALGGAGYGLSQLSSSSSIPAAASGSAATGAAAGRGAPAGAAGSSSFARDRHQNGTYSGGDQVVVVPSDLDYQPATWREQVQAQLKASQSLRAQPASASVAACVLHVTGGNPRLLVETAYYRGTPATIIVVSGSHGDQAWVTGPACSATNSDILARAVLSRGTSGP